ncbi:MAG: response regulator transcription factor [Firmicutes bacterium]|nr:response regulator transcription factor [Bacillota bacterium]
MLAKILVVDDDSKITSFLRRSLSFEGYSVESAKNGQEGLRLAEKYLPDLIILDLMMPVMDGWEMCRQIRQASEVPILMLSARDEVADRVKGLNQGADDYLPKPFALEELLARVRALLRRSPLSRETDHRLLRYSDLVLDPGAREASRGGRAIKLSTKEFELLSMFMEHPRQVLTRESFMDNIWGYDFSGESNVLEVYIGSLRQKLEADQEPRLIHTVRGVGYVLKE